MILIGPVAQHALRFSLDNLSAEQLLERFAAGNPRQVEFCAALNPAQKSSLNWALPYFNPLTPAGTIGRLAGCSSASAPCSSSSPQRKLAGDPIGAVHRLPTTSQHLLLEEFEQADRLTSAVLRQLAGEQAFVADMYFSEVPPMSGVDQHADRSGLLFPGRFGFSVQWRLLQSFDGRYDQLWPRIGWKNDGVWTRYPGAFDWSLKAPEGHMPLINQLRGVRLMDAVLNHPALVERRAS